jgi:hypothetical protein
MARRTNSDWNPRPDDDDPRDAPGNDGEFNDDGDDEADAHDEADRDRFASETAYCPECGAEVFDAADICPQCYSWIDGDTTHKKPSRLRASLKVIVVAVLLGVMIAGVTLYALARIVG